jgi:glutamine amidotransferase
MIAIIDYRAGNLRSVERALAHLGEPCRITDRPLEILSAERVIFPGVGAAGAAMDRLRSTGLDGVIHEVVGQGTPFLGICLGAQIILEKSDEGDAACLGLIEGVAKKFTNMNLKIPHMGWNTISPVRPHPVLAGIDERAQFYFVHSYYPAPRHSGDVVASTDYGDTFASVIGKGNIIAMQFHPEKSGPHGLAILRNFCEWDGTTERC